MKILLIEDDDLVREGLSGYLSDACCQVTAAGSAEAGLTELRQQQFDLILCDFRLPGMNGLEFFQQAHEWDSQAVRVLMTAYGTPDLEAAATRAGVQEFMAKPLTLETMEQLIVRVRDQASHSSRPGLTEGWTGELKKTVNEEQPMRHILVIDDSVTMRRMVLASLRSLERVRFKEAGSGLEAIEQLALGPVDLMILDLNMPDMHGMEVLRFVRSQSGHRHIPILILTTRGEESSKSEALASGASAYLTKPFAPDLLSQEVLGLLGGG